MAWETRGGKRYYYRKRRVGGAVVSKYVGSGPEAELAAASDRRARLARAAARRQQRQEREEARALDRAVDEAGDVARALRNAVLLVNGYHQHKGQWRRKRG